ncbi:FAD:protein FMN transferase [Flavisolibacter sp. BT320]|nr:FAD:protein FMN transferase [Flavisolibacter longurius]
MHRIVYFFLFFFCTTCFAQTRFQFTEAKMGSPFHLVFYAGDSASANRLAAEAFLLVDSLNQVFSDYIPGSELNQLRQTAGSGKSAPVSAPLYEVLQRSQQASRKSKGAFVITIGPLSHLWRAARKNKTFPPADSIRLALKRSGYKLLQVDAASKKVKLLLPGMQLDAGGIAKGYIAQQVISFLGANGVSSALADAGGDIACSDPPPGKKGWTVGINVPGNDEEILPETLAIRNSAVATSGDLYQYIEHEGKRYSHIIDPRTGYGVPFQRNVTVIAADGATADWLATACSILSIKESLRLADAENAALLITQVRNGKPGYHTNKRMKKRLRS